MRVLDTEPRVPGSPRYPELKPLVNDNRRLQRHKVLVYLWGGGWSSSLKRILSAGAAVAVPSARGEVFQEMLEQQIFRELCPDCLLTYDVDHVCTSLLAALDAETDESLRERARRTHEVAARELKSSALFSRMTAALALKGRRPADVQVSSDGSTLSTGGLVLQRRNCSELLDSLGGVTWQMWYNRLTPACDLQKETEWARLGI